MPMPMVCMAAAGRAVPNVSAAGSSVAYTYVNGYKVYTFNASGVLNILRPGGAAGELTYLVIGGGGAGGFHHGGDAAAGGGGGGGAKQGTAVIKTQQNVTVGAGGTINATTGIPSSGGSSSIGAFVTAYGGGFGAWSTTSTNVSAGGSGQTGGGAGSFNTTTRIPGTGSGGQNGGTAYTSGLTNDKQGGGGGGGRINSGNLPAETAQNATGGSIQNQRKAGNGGAGFTNDWTGIVRSYCGGGGGGATAGANAAAATRGMGVDGGGNGSVYASGIGLLDGFAATAGTPNTGGGGGGGSGSTAVKGAAGGSGVVIIRHRF